MENAPLHSIFHDTIQSILKKEQQGQYVNEG
jgi:hypothetical protein